MAETEKFTVSGKDLVEKIKQLIHEGNIRRVRIIHQGRTMLELPLSIGAPAAALDWQVGRIATEPWRVLTAALVHLSLLHLAANLSGCAVLALLGWRAALPASAAWAGPEGLKIKLAQTNISPNRPSQAPVMRA